MKRHHKITLTVIVVLIGFAAFAEYSYKRFAFRGPTLTVLGEEVKPEWQIVKPPESWFEGHHVAEFGYASYDGITLIPCSTRIEKTADGYVADFSDLKLENGKSFEIALVKSDVNNFFGYTKRGGLLVLKGQIGENGHLTIDTRIQGQYGDAIYEFIPKPNLVFDLVVTERCLLNGARRCQFSFQIKPDGLVTLL